MQMNNMSGVDVRGFGNKLFICRASYCTARLFWHNQLIIEGSEP